MDYFHCGGGYFHGRESIFAEAEGVFSRQRRDISTVDESYFRHRWGIFTVAEGVLTFHQSFSSFC